MTKERHLHIITHDVPWPADFGGVMDLFYKIKTLYQSGVKIYLHCFINNRPQQEALKNSPLHDDQFFKVPKVIRK